MDDSTSGPEYPGDCQVGSASMYFRSRGSTSPNAAPVPVLKPIHTMLSRFSSDTAVVRNAIKRHRAQVDDCF